MNDEPNYPARRHALALLLALIDVLLIAAGVGLVYLYLTALPQSYAVAPASSTTSTDPTRALPPSATPTGDRRGGVTAPSAHTPRAPIATNAPPIQITRSPDQGGETPPLRNGDRFTGGEVIRTADAIANAILLIRRQRRA